jgi:uncharacterized protein (TIGR03545 family)
MERMKKKRLPKLFRKPIPAGKLEKKVLRRIHVESERKFLMSRLQQDDQGRYVLPEELNADDRKHLKRLAKAVGKNRGVLVGWKAGILAFVLIATVGFNFFLKNRILEHAAETALQRLFNAAVEIEGTEFSILKGTVGFSSVAIADEQEPMRNLVELGRTNISLDTGRILSRRIILNEIACREIRFNTPRTTSGALPASTTTNESESETAAEESGGKAAELKSMGLEIGRESARRMIADYRDSLQAPGLIDSVQEKYTETNERWSSRVDSTDAQMETLQTSTRELLDTDVSSIDTAREVQDYLAELKELQSSVQETQKNFQAAYEEYQADAAYIRESRQSINTAIEEDLSFLKDSVGSFGSDAAGIVASAAQPVLRERLGNIYTYGERILRIYRCLHESSTGKESRFTDRGREGTTVNFPYREYPGFLFKHFELSTGSAASSGFSEFTIDNLTGDQETWGKPTLARFRTYPSFGREDTSLSADLTIDSREGSVSLMESSSALRAYPLEISEGLETIYLDSLRAESDSLFRLSIQPDLSGEGEAEISLTDLQLGVADIGSADSDSSETGAMVGEAISEILGSTDSVRITVSFGFADGAINRMKITTDIDEQLNDRIGEYALEQADKAAAEIESAFYDYIDEELEASDMLSDEISQQGREIVENIRNAEDLETAIEEQIEEQQAALKSRAQEEVEKQTEELKEKAKEGLEGLGEDLKLPGF